MTIYDLEWVHVSRGTRYRIVAISVRESDLLAEVVYKDVETGVVRHRPVTEFFDGRFRDSRLTNPEDGMVIIKEVKGEAGTSGVISGAGGGSREYGKCCRD